METEAIRLPRLLSPGCVLQQGEDTRVWGFTEPGRKVTVIFQEDCKTVTSDETGRFEVKLDKVNPGGPFTLEVFCENGGKKVVEPVYAGEVFVCAGQSNMELPMSRVRERYSEEFTAGGCRDVHVYKVAECTEFTEELENHREAGWSACTGESLAGISAFSYFFGQYLYEKKKVPIGILNLSLGGTPVEAWTSKEGLRPYPRLLQIRESFQDKDFRKRLLTEEESRQEAWYRKLEEKEKEQEQQKKQQKEQEEQQKEQEKGQQEEQEEQQKEQEEQQKEQEEQQKGQEKRQQEEQQKEQEEQQKVQEQAAGNAEEKSAGNGEKVKEQGFLQVPGFFSDQGLEEFCGLICLRKRFYAGKEWEGKEALLRLGTLVDSDIVYLNGIFVGETGYRYPPRRYPVSAGLLKEGENELEIRLVCRDGQGRVTPGKPYDIVSADGGRIDLEGQWEYEIKARMAPAPEQFFINRQPTCLFQGMVSPCLPYTVQGVVWYQGESNDRNPNTYEERLKAMISDWRNRWQQEKLPFVVIQLPNCGVDIAGGEAWPLIRKAQYQARELPQVTVTVNLDLGEDWDLHPLNKKDAAYRAFLAVSSMIYQEDVAAEGPGLLSAERQGNKLVLTFQTEKGQGLEVLEGETPEGFEVQEETGGFYRVPASIEGNTVVLDCGMAKNIRKVRYAWTKTPGRHLLCSREGLLAAPFCKSVL